MTSSSSSFPQSWTYNVFLSFSGLDVRKNYVDHLYSALEQRGISTYKADEELPRRESNDSARKAIEGSQIAVIVFSEYYADSTWCLEEVKLIMRCRMERGQIVLPVFYHVDPWEVREQKGKYKEAFEKHEFQTKKKVNSWRKALSDATDIFGFEVNDFADGCGEGKSIHDIVETISQRTVLSSSEKDLKSPSSKSIWASFSRPWSYVVSLIGTKPSIQDLISPSSKLIPASFSRSWSYDVFLNFRGAYIRKSFVDHLYKALEQRGISTYKYQEALPRGEPIKSSIWKAIEGSQIAIIIFSPNYADSSWCLEEVTHIMRCCYERGQIVFPVFYHVDPSQVRRKKGQFGKAFRIYEFQKNKEVESWRKALSDAAILPGVVVSLEPESIKEIVGHISTILSSSQSIPVDLIRKERIVQDLESSSQSIQAIHKATIVEDLEQSSSQSILASWSYDVFISHGEDSRNTFVDHLYTALEQQNIYVFREDVTLKQGTSIHSSPFKSIEESKIAVIVFSKNYADSSSCLDELAYIIMKCKEDRGQTVLPIFYNMEASDVRHQKHKYGEAFEKHNLEYNDKIGHEAECIEEIVGKISQLLHLELSFSHGLPSSASSYSVTASYSQWWNHDIFLSFTGEYDSKTFVDHLYSTLVRQGIHAYKSDGIHSHNDSIEESKIAIVIFTKNYCRSSRCLDDLSYIMKCIDTRGMHVMPIFYDVSSSDVKEQGGEFGKEFDKQEFENMAKVETWRKALKGACNHSGWSLKHIANGHEGRYIQDIVNTISHMLFSLTSKIKNDLIGIEPRLEDLKLKLLEGLKSKLAVGSDDVRMVVVGGVGGSGKTTIASCFYMEFSCQFEGRCFVENIREESSKYDTKQLQQKILSTILKKEVVVSSEEEGIRQIQELSCKRNVLIVLDDVINSEQVDLLFGSRDSFGKRSRIIVTSRDEHFPLNKLDMFYSLSLLSHDEAIQLFERHAYKGYKPVDKADDTFLQDVISYANGLPLTLKILVGCFLYEEEKDKWKSLLTKLKDTPNLGLMNKLKISYDALSDANKELFLDIACFFKGKLVDSSMMMLFETFHDNPVGGVNELVGKSLITISNGMFGIHKLVEEMAHYIIRGEPEHPKHLEEYSRVWQSSDVSDICAIDTTKDNNKIQALYAPYNDTPPNLLKAVAKMKRLRLLNVGQQVKKEVEVPIYLSDELRFISWENYPASSFPESFQPRRLFTLILKNGLQKALWQGIKVLPTLKVLDLHGSENLTMTPDFKGLRNLERLVLSGCSSLEEIDPSIGWLERLTYLNLDSCHMLEAFPPIVRMQRLKTLILSRCPLLLKFPEIKQTMNGLQYLHMEYSGIEVLPSSVGQYCINLVFINLTGCDNLESIQGNFQQLKRRCLILVDLPQHSTN